MALVMPIVSVTRGFAFVSNPKAGSTSVEAALGAYQERPDMERIERSGFFTPRHLPACEIASRLGWAEWKALTTFAFIRHPLPWFVSQMAYNADRHGLQVDFTRRLRAVDVHRGYSWLGRFRGQEASPSATQWAFVCGPSREPLVSALWRLDEVREAWGAICDGIGIRPAPVLAHLNASTHPSTEDVLTGDAQRTVLALYAADLDLYERANGRLRQG
jgi:hypothetical protein